MRRSFALRLTLAVVSVGVGTAVLIAVAVNVAFGARFSGYVSAQERARQSEVVAALGASYRAQGRWDPGALGLVDPLAAMAGEQVGVLDADGQLVWTSTAGASGAMGAMGRAMMGTAPLGPPMRVPVVVAGARVGTAVIRLPAAGPSALDQSFRASVERLLLFSGIGAALVAALVGILLARRVTAPVRSLTAAARSLAAGQRSERLSDDAPDELGQMATAFNAMADAVEAEDALRCSFARDVAHELRTPLTVLQSQLEALQDGLARPGPEMLASLHEETLRLTRLVADLETLASADGAPFSVEHETVALVPLVEGAVAELAGAMQERGLSVETRLSEVSVSGDPFRMHQVVANLLSNSLKFVPPGGHVRVELGAEGTWARLVVADDGPGIAAEDLPHVFERFFRGKASGVGGSGIGLAVVAGLVRAHGGEVAVASEPGSGTTFTIRLPQGVPEASRVFARRAPASPTGGVARENRGGPRASTVYPAVDGAAARRTPSA